MASVSAALSSQYWQCVFVGELPHSRWISDAQLQVACQCAHITPGSSGSPGALYTYTIVTKHPLFGDIPIGRKTRNISPPPRAHSWHWHRPSMVYHILRLNLSISHRALLIGISLSLIITQVRRSAPLQDGRSNIILGRSCLVNSTTHSSTRALQHSEDRSQKGSICICEWLIQ